MQPYPQWLHILAWIYLAICFIYAFGVAIDLRRSGGQKMWIMNLVWPITALYWGPVGAWLYRKTKPHLAKRSSPEKAKAPKGASGNGPHPDQVWVADFHCGAGCTLGDIIGEWLVFLAGLSFAGGVFGTELLVDFILAYSIGIVFQYFTIAPMKNLGFRQGIWAAVRADTTSILAFEVGLFGWMALAYYVFFPSPHLHPTQAVHWFMMQVGMIIGFFTAYPANKWLIRKGWKEKMPQYEESKPAMAKHAA